MKPALVAALKHWETDWKAKQMKRAKMSLEEQLAELVRRLAALVELRLQPGDDRFVLAERLGLLLPPRPLPPVPLGAPVRGAAGTSGASETACAHWSSPGRVVVLRWGEAGRAVNGSRCPSAAATS